MHTICHESVAQHGTALILHPEPEAGVERLSRLKAIPV
jgi:hypothetical protein